MVYIDAHTHFGMKGRGMPPNTPEERIAYMDRIGMDAMVTSPPYASISPDRTYDEANAFILNVQRKYPGRFYALARINPHFRRRAVEKAEKALRNGFWGIKFHPRNEAFPANSRELVFPIVEKVKEYGGLILFHSGEADFSHPTLIGDVAENFPEVPIIIGHLGKIYYMDAILIAKWFDNVYVDTSFCVGVHAIEKAVEYAGVEKVLYASDYPQGSVELDTMKVKLADLSRRDKALILGGNVKRILDEIEKER
ncbi:MAG: amidohydrolase family protein [archaeon GB-1845-036]|nr:amidohydrolase family protein [Candidatus Culexmicrobium thermophilum]RLE54826.1 MAG: hypothetical protein DRJ30_04560 [Candidatus Verstraetearchaeota archaeon]HDO21025.1 amidohydrolase [Candidatus Bathyarchaeota archaeon]